MFICLSVLYAFGHGTTKCNEILQEILFRPEKGYRIVFDSKFSTQGDIWTPLCWITTVNAFSREPVCMIVFLKNSRTTRNKDLRFSPLGTRDSRV